MCSETGIGYRVGNITRTYRDAGVGEYVRVKLLALALTTHCTPLPPASTSLAQIAAAGLLTLFFKLRDNTRHHNSANMEIVLSDVILSTIFMISNLLGYRSNLIRNREVKHYK